jgi:hypothetical protein
MKKRTLTRRDFIKAAAIAPLAGGLAFSGLRASGPLQTPPAEAKSRVVLIRNLDVMDGNKKQKPEVVQQMLDEAMAALFGEKDAASAWNHIIKPSDTVGIKTNTWNFLPTGPAVEQALKNRVLGAGVPASRIGLNDRGILSDPLFTNATALLNARPARTHYWSGMGSCLKNMIMFSPKPSSYHGDTCADLATLWSLPEIKGKVRLNVLVMMTPLFHGIGPNSFSDAYTWPYRGLIVGQDPVAVDAVGLRILEAKRREFFEEDKPLQPPAHHIRYADIRHHLGHADPAMIELIKLGSNEGVLV